MSVEVDKNKCTGCKICEKVCPVNAIKVIDKKAVVFDNCIDCGLCINNCPFNALSLKSEVLEGSEKSKYFDDNFYKRGENKVSKMDNQVYWRDTGRGMGRGKGMGRQGMGRGIGKTRGLDRSMSNFDKVYPNENKNIIDNKDEIEKLKKEIEDLNKLLSFFQKKLKELESKKEK